MTSNDELPFRIAVGIFFFLTMLIRIYYQSKVQHETIAVSTHEQRSKLFFQIFALTYLLLLLYVFTSWLDNASLPFSAAVRWIVGGGFLLAYTLLFTATHAALGRNWSGLLEIHTDHILVVRGPYQFIRHPMYAAFILSGIGYLFLSANWIAGGIYLIIAITMYADRVSPEEKMMMEHFGEQYTQYRKTTGRLFPRFRK